MSIPWPPDFPVAHGAGSGQLGGGNMGNITLFSVHAAYGLALCLFAAAACGRFFRAAALPEGSPPELPVGKVPVWFYRPLDLLGVAIIAGVFYLLTMGGAMMNAGEKENVLTSEGVLYSMGFLIFMATVAAAIMSRRMAAAQWLGLCWKGWPWVFLIAPGTVVAMWAFFAGLEGLGYMDLMDRLGVEKIQESVAVLQKSEDTALLVLMALAAVIVAPVCEEVVFRGYLYPALKRFSGPWVSALCTALMFSAAHGSVSSLLPLFVFGLVLVALYEFTGSLWAPMAVHFLFNAATVAIQTLVRLGDLPADALK